MELKYTEPLLCIRNRQDARGSKLKDRHAISWSFTTVKYIKKGKILTT